MTPLPYRVPTYWHGKITTISQRKGNTKNQNNRKGQNYRQIILWNIDSNKNIFILYHFIKYANDDTGVIVFIKKKIELVLHETSTANKSLKT